MHIHVNTDRHIAGREQMAEQVRAAVESALGRFSDRITRIEVHVSDENSNAKGGGADIRCMMEARLNGRPSTAVTQKAATTNHAIVGAAEKLKRVIASTVERLQDARRHWRESRTTRARPFVDGERSRMDAGDCLAAHRLQADDRVHPGAYANHRIRR